MLFFWSQKYLFHLVGNCFLKITIAENAFITNWQSIGKRRHGTKQKQKEKSRWFLQKFTFKLSFYWSGKFTSKHLFYWSGKFTFKLSFLLSGKFTFKLRFYWSVKFMFVYAIDVLLVCWESVHVFVAILMYRKRPTLYIA